MDFSCVVYSNLKGDKISKQCLKLLVKAPHEVKSKCDSIYCSGGLEPVPGMLAGH
jgi:hypothetical protein